MNNLRTSTRFPALRPATFGVASLLIVPLVICNIHGTWLLPTQTNAEGHLEITSLKFGWPITYGTRDIGMINAQWVLFGDCPIGQLSLLKIAVNIGAGVLVLASSTVVVQRLIAHLRHGLQFTLRSLMLFVLWFSVYLIVFGIFCNLYEHWFSIYVSWPGVLSSWPNIVLSWSLNACTAFETMCVPLAISILFQRTDRNE